ncbi:MAG: glycosyltransferase [Rikenellaceae bacterium]
MIPKTIHYCWFGRGEKPASAIKYISGWENVCPDYKIKEWNEDNFDINSNKYVREAYESRKFAFVTDYVRLYALYTEGGVYMDTDVEVLKTYDSFLHHTAFSGFETDGNVPTGMMAAEKGSVWAKELLDEYSNRSFIKSNGELDLTTNTSTITNYMVGKGLVLNGECQDFPGLCIMYPADYFCPKDHRTGVIKVSEETHCIHHFAGSWNKDSKIRNFKHNLKLKFAQIFGGKVTTTISNVITGRAFRR